MPFSAQAVALELQLVIASPCTEALNSGCYRSALGWGMSHPLSVAFYFMDKRQVVSNALRQPSSVKIPHRIALSVKW